MRIKERVSLGGVITGLVALTALVGVAVAAPIKGTDGNDTLTGTERHDVIKAYAGNDTVNALGGFDVVRSGDGNDTADGGDGHDYMRGGKGDDTQYGGPKGDIIFAERGVDVTYGGDGNDHLWAMAHRDVERRAGEPADTLHGENGNDRFHVRDGEADTVTCGAGFDKVTADRKDNVAVDCEVVHRKGAKWLKKHFAKHRKDNKED
jgi:Ca2+-binding RTX toxin-like protein